MTSLKNEIHSDFLLFLENGGVKLIKPSASLQHRKLNYPTINTLFNLKMHVYFLNVNSIIQNINEETIKNCGYLSVKDTINKSVRIAAKDETASFTITHNQNVLRMKKMIIAEENFIKKNDGESFHAVSIKYPWYNNKNEVIGVFGCSFIPSIHGISAPLAQLVDMGLFNVGHFPYSFDAASLDKKKEEICLSNRECECLRHLIRGNTAKMIAKKINLSVRTVEHYLENIKIKLNVNSKFELIDKALEMGFDPFAEDF